MQRQFDTGSVRDAATGKGRPALIPADALLRIGKHYERGAEKYGDRNWEFGQPFSAMLDSLLRHVLKYQMGLADEDHLAAAAFGILGLMHFENQIAEGQLPQALDDRPENPDPLRDGDAWLKALGPVAPEAEEDETSFPVGSTDISDYPDSSLEVPEARVAAGSVRANGTHELHYLAETPSSVLDLMKARRRSPNHNTITSPNGSHVVYRDGRWVVVKSYCDTQKLVEYGLDRSWIQPNIENIVFWMFEGEEDRFDDEGRLKSRAFRVGSTAASDYPWQRGDDDLTFFKDIGRGSDDPIRLHYFCYTPESVLAVMRLRFSHPGHTITTPNGSMYECREGGRWESTIRYYPCGSVVRPGLPLNDPTLERIRTTGFRGES